MTSKSTWSYTKPRLDRARWSYKTHRGLISKYRLVPETQEAWEECSAIESTGAEAQPVRSKSGLNRELSRRKIMNEARDMKFVSLHQEGSN